MSPIRKTFPGPRGRIATSSMVGASWHSYFKKSLRPAHRVRPLHGCDMLESRGAKDLRGSIASAKVSWSRCQVHVTKENKYFALLKKASWLWMSRKLHYQKLRNLSFALTISVAKVSICAGGTEVEAPVINDDVLAKLEYASAKYTAVAVEPLSGVRRIATVISPCLIAIASHVDISEKENLLVYTKLRKGRPIEVARITDPGFSGYKIFRAKLRIAEDDVRISLDAKRRPNVDVAVIYAVNLENKPIVSALPILRGVDDKDFDSDNNGYMIQYYHLWRPLMGTGANSPNGASSAPVFLITTDVENSLVPIGIFQDEDRSWALPTVPKIIEHLMHNIVASIFVDMVKRKTNGQQLDMHTLESYEKRYRDLTWAYDNIVGNINRCDQEVNWRGSFLNHYLAIDRSSKGRAIVRAIRTLYGLPP